VRNDFPHDLYSKPLPGRVAARLRAGYPKVGDKVYFYFDPDSESEYWYMTTTDELLSALNFNCDMLSL